MTRQSDQDALAPCRDALSAVERFADTARDCLRARLAPHGRVGPQALEENQGAAHGMAWYATYARGLRQLLAWAETLEGHGTLGDIERLILNIAFGEFAAQLVGGIPVSASEIVRPADLGLTESDVRDFQTPAVRTLIATGTAPDARRRLVDLVLERDAQTFGARGIDDDSLELAREQFERFVDDKIAPHAQAWHLQNALIPLAVIEEMADLGVFGLTLPERWGGLGLGKIAMCVITEELSRGSLAVGSIGTRSEIAAELILAHGTEDQKQKYLAAIADGAVIPTAVFTEPDIGSDLARLKTRAVRHGSDYRITGNKTWITHGARADLMTLLARTGTPEEGYKGLSMFLAEKPRGGEADPFPAPGMSGHEIEVLGYRGMKEYEIAFDGFAVPANALLGGTEGEGFKQLMATFETARIQTAARAVGVAQSALDHAFRYARERTQFGKPIVAFPRIAGKLAGMIVETTVARQLAYFAAREKDSAKRCDVEAGMAKLLAARVAWTNADSAVQIHGGMGYALETPVSRILCDARILNIFEGTAEIQAQIIARGLLQGQN
ncbi:MAG: acyl-CoA dehydrogenase family protein [Rhodospirillales bacterium]